MPQHWRLLCPCETYLGRDAGRRVLPRPHRARVADRIGAVLLFSDLRHFTQVADKVEPELLAPMTDLVQPRETRLPLSELTLAVCVI